jgi:SAM-dependent methyltransferase
LKCRFCKAKFNNQDIGLCHEAACKKNPANHGKDDFDLYKQAQAFRFRPERSAHHSGSQRKANFIQLIKNAIPIKGAALTIGCANPEEIKLLKKAGFEKVTGIDLCPNFEGIIKMDMHCLDLGIWQFNFILMSHSLEHAYDWKKVIKECDKVLKPGGYIAIEVPVHYRINDVDRIDFMNAGGLIYNINETMEIERVYAKDIPHGEKDNFCATDISRVIVRKL